MMTPIHNEDSAWKHDLRRPRDTLRPLDISCIHLQTTREHQGLRETWNSVNPSTAHSIFSLSSPVERLLRSVKITWPFPHPCGDGCICALLPQELCIEGTRPGSPDTSV
ncbi:hypothetical protein Naga_100022g1 [Nannochloropsis gaditana]|uniref:Uncharacterized protein n=1 Tax=Nannochloropsis gaditana TaxID=72520 RepID=W7U9Y3_9STRA|nr:hypothetical protein Naga_100022g1 [Nannochloropsis gaditana]